MNFFTLIVVLSVSALTAAEFYSHPEFRFYYSYHPYRPRRSTEEVIQLNTTTASNDTVPIQEAVLTNSTSVQNDTLEFKAPVVEKIVENNITNSSSTNFVYFSFIGDQDSTVNCTYNYTSSLVSCEGPTGFVICNTTVDFGHLNQLSFDVVSFGLKQVDLLIASTLVKYKIFPFKLVSNNTDTTIVYEYKYPIYGFEIMSFMNRTSFVINNTHDLYCFNQLIGLLNESKLLQQVNTVVNEVLDSVQKGFF